MACLVLIIREVLAKAGLGCEDRLQSARFRRKKVKRRISVSLHVDMLELALSKDDVDLSLERLTQISDTLKHVNERVQELILERTSQDTTSSASPERFRSKSAAARFTITNAKTDISSGENKRDSVSSLTCGSSNGEIESDTIMIRRSWLEDLNQNIGEGKFSTVWLSRYGGTLVAVKESRALDGEEELREEVLLAMRLQHPNIVQVYGYTIEPLGMVMEYCSHGTLQNVIEAYKITEKHQLKWSLDLAEGLSHLHKKNTLHHDIKSSNIVISNDGVAKWTDFGLAERCQNLDKSLSPTNGTPIWLPPECWRDQYFSSYSLKSEIWGLGLVMYQMVERKKPYEKEMKQALRKLGSFSLSERIMKGHPDFRKTHYSLLKTVITKCLHLKASRRLPLEQICKLIKKHLGSDPPTGTTLLEMLLPAMNSPLSPPPLLKCVSSPHVLKRTSTELRTAPSSKFAAEKLKLRNKITREKLGLELVIENKKPKGEDRSGGISRVFNFNDSNRNLCGLVDVSGQLAAAKKFAGSDESI
mmetsp:Transcript_30002/g.52659  ORF Transcript_30002/g.52659 Transcript_30002/m.52659 type:complete len:530 (-) Transcript_30002:273-1862(-)|eukprot:CAMPEP_0197535196 /NCGR_PEP_ID=MMETSP1318-20131121/49723_1 /TAXON_ID=552666 /ORGANISM="Partenskyella glossopodia, Strain RCC365" /LENGTH=529 /DNA_ID=CAMNT_0043092707 /DNA_START=168 /DNA_END=1757 /DNA_ORIENTATION=+